MHSRSTREIPRVLFSDAATDKRGSRRSSCKKGSGAHISVKGWEGRSELVDKECDVDGGWGRTYVMTIERDGSSRWTNLMELKAFDRQVYST